MQLSTELFTRQATITEWTDETEEVFFFEDLKTGHVYILYVDGMEYICHKVTRDYFWVELHAVERNNLMVC
jgi:hypothetical protein